MRKGEPVSQGVSPRMNLTDIARAAGFSGDRYMRVFPLLTDAEIARGRIIDGPNARGQVRKRILRDWDPGTGAEIADRLRDRLKSLPIHVIPATAIIESVTASKNGVKKHLDKIDIHPKEDLLFAQGKSLCYGWDALQAAQEHFTSKLPYAVDYSLLPSTVYGEAHTSIAYARGLQYLLVPQSGLGFSDEQLRGAKVMAEAITDHPEIITDILPRRLLPTTSRHRAVDWDTISTDTIRFLLQRSADQIGVPIDMLTTRILQDTRFFFLENTTLHDLIRYGRVKKEDGETVMQFLRRIVGLSLRPPIAKRIFEVGSGGIVEFNSTIVLANELGHPHHYLNTVLPEAGVSQLLSQTVKGTIYPLFSKIEAVEVVRSIDYQKNRSAIALEAEAQPSDPVSVSGSVGDNRVLDGLTNAIVDQSASAGDNDARLPVSRNLVFLGNTTMLGATGETPAVEKTRTVEDSVPAKSVVKRRKSGKVDWRGMSEKEKLAAGIELARSALAVEGLLFNKNALERGGFIYLVRAMVRYKLWDKLISFLAPEIEAKKKAVVPAKAGRSDAEKKLIKLILLDKNWPTAGNCVHEDPDALFVEKAKEQKKAKEICIGCPVKFECLIDALQTDEQYGIRGGMTPRERRAAIRRASGDPARVIYAIERSYEQFLGEGGQ